MKALTFTKYAFSIIGLAALTGAAMLYMKTHTFLLLAAQTTGTVVDFVTVESAPRSSSGGVSIQTSTSTYAPVVEFTAENGSDYKFTSSISTYPPAYDLGETVDVLYDTENPGNASINSFFSLWGGVLITGGLGLLFATVGAVMIAIGLLKGASKKRLVETGLRIKTRFHSILLNPGLVVNGRNPYQIRSVWKNPRTAETHLFDSDNIWFDPTGHVPDEITVYIEHENPRRYFVDLSFLPVN